MAKPSYLYHRVASVLGILSPLSSVVGVRWFVTQDGPAHLYSAWMALLSMRHSAAALSQFDVRFIPMPNVLAHALIVVLLSFISAQVANAVVIVCAAAAVFSAAMSLRHLLQHGQTSFPLAGVLVLLSITRLWLLGFYGFALGVAFMLLALRQFWFWRSGMRAPHAVALAALGIAAFLSHLVPATALMIALTLLCLLTPGLPRRSILWTSVSLLPAAGLMIWYRGVMESHGGFQPVFLEMRSHSLGAWIAYAHRIKLFSLAGQTSLPFVPLKTQLFVLLSPSVGLVLILGLFLIAAVKDRQLRSEHRGWYCIAIVFLLLGLFGPDTLGDAHGTFLRERVMVIGLCIGAAAMPPARRFTRVAIVLAILGVMVQTGFLWEYALRSKREVSSLLVAAKHLGSRSRILVVSSVKEKKFRSAPLRHAGNLLGLDSERVVWNDYEAALYYFPVVFRRPPTVCFNPATPAPPEAVEARCLIEHDHDRIDELVFFGGNASVDDIRRPWFQENPMYVDENLRIYQRVSTRASPEDVDRDSPPR